MRFLVPLTILFLGLGFASCNKGDGGCGGGSTICTEDFRTVSVRLVRADGTSPSLDSVQTVTEGGSPLRSTTGRPVYGLTGTASGGTVYAAVVDDEWLDGHKNSEIPVSLRGYRGGAIIFDEDFTIGADCCHVYKAAGPDLITIQ